MRSKSRQHIQKPEESHAEIAELLHLIIGRLNQDLELFSSAARSAHKASIDEENQPDNKYDTLALEASYLAQGQANRAQELRRSIEIYKQLALHREDDRVRLTSLVTLEDDAGALKRVFIGPREGGLKITAAQGDVMVITPASPLGKALIGNSSGDPVEIKAGGETICYQIVEVA
jgi:transcription elongation GreA/GreB family factor